MKSDEIIEKIRNQLKMSDPQNRSVVKIFQFHFTDADGKLVKSFVFDFKDLNIYEGSTQAQQDAVVTLCDEDFVRIAQKEVSFAELLEKNKVVVEGDSEGVHRMMEKFRLGKREI